MYKCFLAAVVTFLVYNQCDAQDNLYTTVVAKDGSGIRAILKARPEAKPLIAAVIPNGTTNQFIGSPRLVVELEGDGKNLQLKHIADRGKRLMARYVTKAILASRSSNTLLEYVQNMGRISSVDSSRAPATEFRRERTLRSSNVGTIRSFTLIDTRNNRPVKGYNPIPQSGLIRTNVPRNKLTIRFNTSGKVGSISVFNGQRRLRVENAMPFSAQGDSNGQYFAWAPLKSDKVHLGVQPHSRKNRKGIAGRRTNIYLRFRDLEPQATPTPQPTATPKPKPTTRPTPRPQPTRTPQNDKIIFDPGADLSQFRIQAGNPQGVTVVTDPAGGNARVIRARTRIRDPKWQGTRIRSELIPKVTYQTGVTYTYRYSILWPRNEDVDNRQAHTVTQWHPAYAVRRSGNNLSLAVKLDRERNFRLGTIKRGQWMNFEVKIRFSTGSSGLFELSIDGDKKASFRGQTTTLAKGRVPYMKIGLYNYAWTASWGQNSQSTEHTQYIKNLRISRD